MNQTKPIDRVKILSRNEIATVLADLKRKGKRHINQRQNLVIFRLSACCGLRVSEICGLTLAHVRLGSYRPHIRIPKPLGKRRKARNVPLWWDKGTLADIQAWKAERERQGASGADPFVCSQCKGLHSQTGKPSFGKPLIVPNAQTRWKTAIKCLGPERVADLSIHCGRHSFCSHSLAGGRTIAEVRDAAGHANIATTSIYLHVIRDDDDEPGDLFTF